MVSYKSYCMTKSFSSKKSNSYLNHFLLTKLPLDFFKQLELSDTSLYYTSPKMNCQVIGANFGLNAIGLIELPEMDIHPEHESNPFCLLPIKSLF
jgi:hypothetical protein